MSIEEAIEELEQVRDNAHYSYEDASGETYLEISVARSLIDEIIEAMKEIV